MGITWVGLISLLFTGGIFLLAFLALLLRGITAIVDAKIEPLKQELRAVTAKLDKLLNRY